MPQLEVIENKVMERIVYFYSHFQNSVGFYLTFYCEKVYYIVSSFNGYLMN